MYLNKKQIEAIEQTFVDAIHNMDFALEKHDEYEATKYAFEACSIAKAIGIMRGTCEDEANEYLYNKYNLHKYE